MKNVYAPQQANLKRRIRDIMHSDEFGQSEEGNTSYWFWKAATQPSRIDHPDVDQARLHEMILMAVQAHTHMPDRCRAIFAALDADDRFRNAVASHLLISAMVQVLTSFEDWEPQAVREPDQQFLREQISRFASRAVAETVTEILIPLASKRGLAEAECDAFSHALEDVFLDYSTDGDHDVLPRYVKERLGATGIDWDLKRHKYIWETVVNDCKDRLRQSLRDNGLGDHKR